LSPAARLPRVRLSDVDLRDPFLFALVGLAGALRRLDAALLADHRELGPPTQGDPADALALAVLGLVQLRRTCEGVLKTIAATDSAPRESPAPSPRPDTLRLLR
jgi:hypothetical protein